MNRQRIARALSWVAIAATILSAALFLAKPLLPAGVRRIAPVAWIVMLVFYLGSVALIPGGLSRVLENTGKNMKSGLKTVALMLVCFVGIVLIVYGLLASLGRWETTTDLMLLGSAGIVLVALAGWGLVKRPRP